MNSREDYFQAWRTGTITYQDFLESQAASSSRPTHAVERNGSVTMTYQDYLNQHMNTAASSSRPTHVVERDDSVTTTYQDYLNEHINGAASSFRTQKEERDRFLARHNAVTAANKAGLTQQEKHEYELYRQELMQPRDGESMEEKVLRGDRAVALL